MALGAYRRDFFEAQSLTASSARAVFDVVLDGRPTASALDVGCGIGVWLSELASRGVQDFVGVDGSWVDRAQMQIPDDRFLEHDLSTPLDLQRRFDLVLSLEVAEHIEPAHADTFVDSLCRHGDRILFSAAIPNQIGTRHVNCQPQSWWAAKFRDRGYTVIDCVRPGLWHNSDVEWYYRQNALIYERRQTTVSRVAEPLLDVVHPEMLQFMIGRRAHTSEILRRTPAALMDSARYWYRQRGRRLGP